MATPSPSADAAAPPGVRQSLRLWLRLLTCANMVEQTVRARLRKDYATTLPRFDMLATLDRAPEGLTMGELSRRLLVSNGNVTVVADRLATEGLITREPSPHDRRAQIVGLTDKGRAIFTEMAGHHQGWIDDMFGGLDDHDKAALTELLGLARKSVVNARSEGGTT